MKNNYRSTALLFSVVAMVICLLVLDAFLFADNPLYFWISFPPLVLVSGLTIGKMIQIRNSEYRYFATLSESINSANRMALRSFPLPVAIVNDDRRIIWRNELFTEAFFPTGEEHASIDEITQQPLDMFAAGTGFVIEYNGSYYRVYARAPQPHENEIISEESGIPEAKDGDNLTILFFRDITDFRQLQTEHNLSRPVVILAMIDNYEDFFKGGRESEKTEVTIKIDRLFEEYFDKSKSILKKLSPDKFMIIMEERYVAEMYAQNVPILAKAHEITIKDRTPVTLTLGVGRTAKNLAESESYARQALEWALSKGGDQAAFKTESGFDQKGGIIQNDRISSKVKTRIIAERIKELILASDGVFVMGHSWGDFDSVGSAIGLAAASRKLGIPAYAVVSAESNNSGKLISRFEKYDEPIVIDPAIARSKFTDKSLLIIVDTHLIKRLDDQELFNMGNLTKRIVVIDHHRRGLGCIQEPVVEWLDANASSASELVTELIQYFGIDEVLSPLEANALLAGITLDTKDFVMRTGHSAFEAAAYLMKSGAKPIEVRTMFATSISQKIKRSEITSKAALYRGCAISVVDEPFDDIRVVCSQAADEMMSIEGAKASITVYPIKSQDEDGWSFSARSYGEYNVQVIMENLGTKKEDGGGHLSMAGAQLYGITKDEAVARLHAAIDAFHDNNAQKSDI
ncbi:MAG: DHH family phosphoesterase [Oscillospiraceae bacterium]